VARRRCTSASAAWSWAWSRSMMFTGLPRLDHCDEIRYELLREDWASVELAVFTIYASLRPCVPAPRIATERELMALC
jgi:hypothetical protein